MREKNGQASANVSVFNFFHAYFEYLIATRKKFGVPK